MERGRPGRNAGPDGHGRGERAPAQKRTDAFRLMLRGSPGLM
jgi:hypothetical protein